MSWTAQIVVKTFASRTTHIVVKTFASWTAHIVVNLRYAYHGQSIL